MNSKILNVAFLLAFCIWMAGCKKDHTPGPTIPPGPTQDHMLLKDIVSPHLPSPYYHFEYRADSLPREADFASGFSMYEVIYADGRISEMRNNNPINHDTLRYIYDNSGKLAMLKFINQENVIYRLVFFTYDNDNLKEIEWDHKEGEVGYLLDRTLNFTFYPDNNVKTITEHRPPTPGVDDYVSVKTFEEYDDKINVDDFSLIHDGFHDHLFLLQGFRLQHNNPKKETLSVNGVDYYHNDYTYTYNTDGTPSLKTGDFIYLSGSQAGQRFQTSSIYTYY